MEADGETMIINPVRSLMLASAWFMETYKETINPVITLLTDCESPENTLARSELTAIRHAMENLNQSSAQNLILNVIAISVKPEFQPTLDLISSEMCGRKFLATESDQIPSIMAEAAVANTVATLALCGTELMIEGGNYEFEGVIHEGAAPVEISSDKRIASGIGTKPLLASLPNKLYKRTIYAKFRCIGREAEPFALRMRLRGDSMLGPFDLDSGTQRVNPLDAPTSCPVIEQGIRYANYRFLQRSAIGLMNYDSRDYKTRMALCSIVIDNFHRTSMSYSSECLAYTVKRFKHAYAPMSPQMANEIFINLNRVYPSLLKPLLQTHPLHNQLQDLTHLSDSLVELAMSYLPELFPFIVSPSTQALKLTISYPMASATGQLYTEHVPFYVQANSPGFVKIARGEAPPFLSAYVDGDIEVRDLAKIMLTNAENRPVDDHREPATPCNQQEPAT